MIKQLKICSRCGQAKSINEFHRNKAKPDGHVNSCKICNLSIIYHWRKFNPEKWAAIKKRNRITRSAYYAMKSKAWRDKNPVRFKNLIKKWQKENAQYVLDQAKQYYRDNKERCDKTKKNWRLQKMYGITLNQFNVMLENQSQSCAVCGKTKHLVVDHCHKTGFVRGLICRKCNLGLGHADDSIETLEKMIAYLKNRRNENGGQQGNEIFNRSIN